VSDKQTPDDADGHDAPEADTAPQGDAAPDDAAPDDATDATDASAKYQDIRERLRQFTQPFVESLDGRLKDQVDRRVDRRVDETLAARLSVIERAIADLDRSIRELQERLDSEGPSVLLERWGDRRSRSRRTAQRTVTTMSTSSASRKNEKTRINTKPR
jgi:hypothetical protein